MTPSAASTETAEVELACDDLAPTLAFFTGRLGFRVEAIFPADAPKAASISGHGLRLRLAPGSGGAGVVRILYGRAPTITAPNGTRIDFVDPDPRVESPPLAPEFLITRADDGPAPGEGRAGMVYRDLIPGRLGGRFIASHIVIPQGGPVADWVHFHKVRFQIIFCRAGWVRLVYEDQGAPFVMSAGDCVLQPPRIRHRVLESSPGLEVVEVGCPAVHETLADHAMTLPTGRTLPDRDYDGQRFVRHMAADAPWVPDDAGGEAQVTGVAAATGGLGDVRVLRPAGAETLRAAPDSRDLDFGFILEGAGVLDRQGRHPLGPCDAFVIPPGEGWTLHACTPDLRVLRVTA